MCIPLELCYTYLNKCFINTCSFFLQMVAHYIQHSELCFLKFMIYLGDQSLSVHEASFLWLHNILVYYEPQIISPVTNWWTFVSSLLHHQKMPHQRTLYMYHFAYISRHLKDKFSQAKLMSQGCLLIDLKNFADMCPTEVY